MNRNTRCLTTAALALCACLFVDIASAQSGWQAVYGKGYVVEMPGKPAYDPKDEQTILERGSIAYMVQITVLAPTADVSNPRRILQGSLDGSVQRLSEKQWATVNWIQRQGLLAVEAIAKYNSQTVLREMLILDERRLFAVMYAGPTNTEHAPDVERFFQSFRITR